MFTLVAISRAGARLTLSHDNLSLIREECDALERNGWMKLELRRGDCQPAANHTPLIERLNAALLVYEATVYTMAVYLLDAPDYVWKQIIAAADAYEEVTGEESVCRELRQLSAVEICGCPDRT